MATLFVSRVLFFFLMIKSFKLCGQSAGTVRQVNCPICSSDKQYMQLLRHHKNHVENFTMAFSLLTGLDSHTACTEKTFKLHSCQNEHPSSFLSPSIAPLHRRYTLALRFVQSAHLHAPRPIPNFSPNTLLPG
jgi:hypothetical protein